jgi:hypothetical protein
MAKTRRGGATRRIPVESLSTKPTKPGVEVLKAMGVNIPENAPPAQQPGKRAADSKRSGGLISSIFRDPRGKPIDMTKLDRAPRHRRGPVVLLVILGVLAAAAVAGFSVFQRNNKFSNTAVAVTLTAPAAVASGAPVTLTATVVNQESVALKDTELTLQYPEGFTFTESTPKPENTANQAWSLGGLSPGETRTVTITGVLLGSIGESATFTATASYFPANFSSEFTKTTTATVTVNASRLTLTIDGPPSAVAGRSTTFTLTVANTAEEKLTGVVLTTEFPATFAVTSAEPKATEGNARWSLGSLDAGATVAVEIAGTFSASVGDSVVIPWRVTLPGDNGETPQAEINQLVLMVNPTITLTVSVNGSTDDGTVSLGDTLEVKVAFANASDLEVSHATLAATVEGRPVDLSTVKDPAKGKRNGSTITWTKTQIPALNELKPGDSGSVTFTVGTLPNLTVQTAADRNLAVKVSAALTPGSAGPATTTPILTRFVVTRAMVTSEARYTAEDGETVGSGPLPPQVGSSTTYRIIWTLGNTTNDVETVSVVALLPEDVQFTGKNITTSSGALTFDPANRTVRWALPKLPAGAGTLGTNLSATFSVTITPTSAQVGTTPVLVGSVALSGTDTFANVPVTAGAQPVTTAGSNDPTTAGKGTVVAASGY